MSKESYARGFCKAAEAAGVDPVALAKYAQQYKTDGYAPEISPWFFDDGKHTSSIPEIEPLYGDSVLGVSPNIASIRKTTDGRPFNSHEALRREIDGKYNNWVMAHTNAANKVLKKLENVDFPKDLTIRPEAMKLLEKIYHDEMKRTTSAPPARASVPVSSAARPVEVKPGLN